VTPIDAVVGHHLNPYASGVARFNEILAARLGVPVLGLFDDRVRSTSAPLLSFKPAELDTREQAECAELLDVLADRARVRLFLHDWAGIELEERLVRNADFVWCGNDEVHAAVAALGAASATLWAPGLVLDDRVFEPAELSVFSFGMAHKLRVDMFARLRELLEASGRSYAVYISAANHETASIGEAQSVFEEMSHIFPRGLYFLGNLSDVAVFNHVRSATFFAAFFPSGVRANNTSIASAMEHGAVVVTNLDEHSPPYLRHMDNVIDITACDALPDDPLALRRISVRAMETAREHSWDALMAAIAETAGEPSLARVAPEVA
jgi:hypothetical protein